MAYLNKFSFHFCYRILTYNLLQIGFDCTEDREAVYTKMIRGGWGKSGQGQIGPLVYIHVTSDLNIGIKVVMILL